MKINNTPINNNTLRQPNTVTPLNSSPDFRSNNNPPRAIQPAISQLSQEQSVQLLQGFRLPVGVDKDSDITSISLKDNDNTNSLSRDDSVAVRYIVDFEDSMMEKRIQSKVREVVLPLEILLERIEGLADLLNKVDNPKEDDITNAEIKDVIMKGVIELMELQTYFMNNETMEDIKDPYDYSLST
ncbi:MAG: hypothetical protein V3U78_03765 [Thiotrichaceae bacterium]